jgi:hypothetical protein
MLSYFFMYLWNEPWLIPQRFQAPVFICTSIGLGGHCTKLEEIQVKCGRPNSWNTSVCLYKIQQMRFCADMILFRNDKR